VPVPVGERNRGGYPLGREAAPAAIWMLKQVQHDDDRATQCICKRAAAPGWATYFDIIVKYDMVVEAPMESALTVRGGSALGR
jgi:hypothetical protein